MTRYVATRTRSATLVNVATWLTMADCICAGICPCMKILFNALTRFVLSVVALPVAEAILPKALVGLRSTLKAEILLFTRLSASVSLRIAVAVFSIANSGALVVLPGITYPGGKKLNTEGEKYGFSPRAAV